MTLRIWIIFAWISLPTVMYGGYALLRLANRGDALTPFQITWFPRWARSSSPLRSPC